MYLRRYVRNLPRERPYAYHCCMPSLRKTLLLSAAFLFVGTAAAQRSGVLLGVAGASSNAVGDTQSFDTIHEPQYRTLWIARDASGELKVLSTLPELIVPRQDGFWHVGVKQFCEFDYFEDGGNERLRQVVWAAPATQSATVEQSHPCTAHKPEDYAPPYSRSEQDKNKISQCGFELVNLLYLSPAIISMSTYTGQSEDCEARGGRYNVDFKVRNFDSDEALSFGQLLGAKAHDAYVRALPARGQGDGGEDCGESEETRDTGWRIAHSHGRWHPYAHQDLGYFGCAVDAAMSIPLPGSLTGDVSSAFDWRRLQSLQSKADPIADVYVSPAGDLLIATSHSETRFFELRAGVPGKLLLTLPSSGIVAAQWATGAHIQDWTEKISALAIQHLPAPVMRVKPASN